MNDCSTSFSNAGGARKREIQLSNEGAVFRSELAFASVLLRGAILFSHSSMITWVKRVWFLAREENLSETTALGNRDEGLLAQPM